ncbi:hypothetical protein [Actinophytocola sp. KF-1]
MANILIGYDLNTPGQDYQSLTDRIKELGSGWWHHLDSTWIIVTRLSTADVRDDLKRFIGSNDELFVVDITGESAAWTGFNTEGSSWLKTHL